MLHFYLTLTWTLQVICEDCFKSIDIRCIGKGEGRISSFSSIFRKIGQIMVSTLCRVGAPSSGKFSICHHGCFSWPTVKQWPFKDAQNWFVSEKNTLYWWGHLQLKNIQSIEVKQRIFNSFETMFALYSKRLVTVKTHWRRFIFIQKPLKHGLSVFFINKQ